MAQVPTLESPSVQEEPLPGRAYPRISDEVPEGAYGGVSRGIEAVSEAATQEQAHEKLKNDNLRVIDANTQLEAGRDALLYGQNGQGGAFSLHGTDAINLPSKLLPEYQKLADKISGTLTPDQQQIFKQHVSVGQRSLNLDLNRYEFAESNRLANEVYSNGVDQAVSSASLGWRDPVVLGKSRADLKSLVDLQGDREGWDPATREVKTRAALARMDGGVIDSMLTAGNSSGALAYFKSAQDEITAFNPKVAEEIHKSILAGQVTDTANGVLSAYKSSVDEGARALTAVGKSDLTPEQQAQVTGMVDRGRNDYAQMVRQDPGVRATLTKLDADIASGTVSPNAVGTVESLWRKGAFTDDQRLVMRDEVLRAQKRGDNERASFEFVSSAYEARQALDPKEDKKAVDHYANVVTYGQKAGTPAYNNAMVEITNRVGVVPDSAVSFGRASLVGGEPQQAAAGAQLLASIQRVNSRAYLEATDAETRTMAASINDAVKAGASPEAAVTMARDNAQRSKADQQILDAAWQKADQNKVRGQAQIDFDRNLIRGGLKEDEQYREGGFHLGNTVPAPPLPMVGEFQTLTRDYFNHTGGNIVQARALALEDLKAHWGVTEVNGKRELMKYAPEHMVPGLTADAIHAEMAKDGYGAAHLQESPEDTGPSGGRIWNLVEPDKFGAWTVVLGSDNRPVRFQVPQPKPDVIGYEAEAQRFEDEQGLKQTKERKEFAAEHPVQAPGF